MFNSSSDVIRPALEVASVSSTLIREALSDRSGSNATFIPFTLTPVACTFPDTVTLPVAPSRFIVDPIPTLVSMYAFPVTWRLASGSLSFIPTLLFSVSTNKRDEPTCKLLAMSTFPENIWLVVATIYSNLDKMYCILCEVLRREFIILNGNRISIPRCPPSEKFEFYEVWLVVLTHAPFKSTIPTLI